jgi:hypothetical protein
MTEQTPKGIDPRGPRFGASITSILLIVTVFLALDPATETISLALLAFIVAMFVIGATQGTANHPYGLIFKKLIKPSLSEPKELEDPRPPKFAQAVGLLVTGTGLVLALIGVPYAIAIAAGFAFIAAFLNAAFAYCLGCQMYLGLKRLGVIKH